MTPTSRQQSEAGRTRSAGPIDEALDQAVGRVADLLRDEDGNGDGAEPVPLVRLRALAQIQSALERQVQQTAQDAGEAGASYAQLGAAWHISRQGARQRWPGLVAKPGAAPAGESPR